MADPTTDPFLAQRASILYNLFGGGAPVPPPDPLTQAVQQRVAATAAPYNPNEPHIGPSPGANPTQDLWAQEGQDKLRASRPSWANTLTDAANSGISGLLGFLGMGDNSHAARGGELLGAALPLSGVIEGLPSRLKQAAESLPEVFHPNKALSVLKNMASPEEMAYRDVGPYLQAQGSRGTRTGLLQHLESHPEPQLNVKTLGEPAFMDPRYTEGGPPETPTKYQQYQLPGGNNYRETMIKLQPPVRPYDAEEAALMAKPLDARTAEDYAALARRQENGTLAPPAPTFESGHWDDPNVLVHVRSNERYLNGPSKYTYVDPATGEPSMAEGAVRQTNPKGRFLEEVQSDWHQQGNKEGYYTPPEKPVTAMQVDVAYSDFGNKLRAMEDAFANHPDKFDAAQQAVKSARDEWNRLRILYENPNDSNLVPDAPFKKSWPDLALKQQLLDVAKRPDLEWIGHTAGATQAERYNMASAVDNLDYSYDSEAKDWRIRGSKGGILNAHTPWIPNKDLEQWVGKGAAQALRDHRDSISTLQPKYENMIKGAIPIDTSINSSENSGMQQFYDQTLPSKLQKLLKPFGGKVELSSIPVPGKGNVPAWIAKLTPEMKAAILKRGFPMMSVAGAAGAALNDPVTDVTPSTVSGDQ